MEIRPQGHEGIVKHFNVNNWVNSIHKRLRRKKNTSQNYYGLCNYLKRAENSKLNYISFD